MGTAYLRRRKKKKGEETGVRRLVADRATALRILRRKDRRGTFGKGLPVLDQLR